MGLFKKKEKKKVKDRMGCVVKILLLLIFAAAIVIGVMGGLKNAEKLYGEQLETIKGYVEEINKPVNENELMVNKIAPMTTFQEQANSCGFDGYQNLEGVLLLNSTLNMQDNVFGALLNTYIHSKESMLSIGEFSITNENTLRIVFVYDLKDLKSLLSSAGEIIPSKMYLTNYYTFSVAPNTESINQVTVTKNKTLINQLEESKSNSIINFLETINDQGISKLFKTFDDSLFKVVNDIAIKTESNLNLTFEDNKGYVKYVK